MDAMLITLRQCVQVRRVVVLLLVFTSPLAFSAEAMNVYTVNYPLSYFAQHIGGKHVNVRFPAPRNVDPAYWTPDIKTIGQYQAADLILLNGAGYAKWIQTVSLPRSRTVNTSAKFTERLITEKSDITHSHGPTGDHSHTGTAFTTWLDMRQAVVQAETIMYALIRKQPQNETEFVKNFKALEQDLLSLDNSMTSIIAKDPHQSVLASHPVYQYLARRYNLNMKSVLWEPGKFPLPAQWSALSRLLQSHSAKLMLWEARPLTDTADKLAQQSVRVVVFEPCANVPQEGDFMSVMQQNIQNLKTGFSN